MLDKVTTLIFDLDGTISDPSTGIGRCLNHAFECHGLPAVSMQQVNTIIGPPLDEAFCRLCPQVQAEMIPGLVSKYRERYALSGYAENVIYPGIREALGRLAESGIAMGVCTSKRRDFAEKILDMFGVLPHFRFVSGGNIGIRKSEQLAELLEAGAIDHGAVMIGDRDVDITSARANGLRSVGVLWGFGDEGELGRAGADLLLGKTSELPGLAPQ